MSYFKLLFIENLYNIKLNIPIIDSNCLFFYCRNMVMCAHARVYKEIKNKNRERKQTAKDINTHRKDS